MKPTPTLAASAAGGLTLVGGLILASWYVAIPFALAVGAGAYLLTDKATRQKRAPTRTLPEYFAECRQYIREMRAFALTIRSDFKDVAFAGDVNALATTYDRIVGELEKNPLFIVETGGVDVRLQALRDSLKQWVERANHARNNVSLRDSLAIDKQRFADIQRKAEENLQQLQATQQSDANARLKALLAVICPDQHKLVKISEQKKAGQTK